MGHALHARVFLRQGGLSRGTKVPLPASVKRTLLLRELLPCNPAAETALRPLIWHTGSLSSHLSPSPEESFYPQTPGLAENWSTELLDARIIVPDMFEEFCKKTNVCRCSWKYVFSHLVAVDFSRKPEPVLRTQALSQPKGSASAA